MPVIFVRHADPKQPYDNYNELSLNELDLLATNQTQPHINTKVARSKIKKHISDGFLPKNRVDAIYYSSALRSKQTAALIAEELNALETNELDYLSEIAFSPKRLVSNSMFEINGMDAVREELYKAVAKSTADEPTPAIVERIHQTQLLISNNSTRTIVVVTHGFFMRLLQIALLKDKLTFSVSDQKRATNYDYLQGFTYDFPHKIVR